jgi:hypothetical protein
MGYLRILLCLLWLYQYFASWAMSHRHRLLRRCRNTALPSLAISILCLLSDLPLGLLCLSGYSASRAILPLGLFCLLGLPLGLLCLLGYFASWATLPLGLVSWAILPTRLLCLLGYFDMLPLGPCLIDIVCFDNAGILICLLGCANTGHLLVCKNDKLC